jgi:hypothetical protein
MKETVRLIIATLLLVGSLSPELLADGGAPPPMCAPTQCKAK